MCQIYGHFVRVAFRYRARALDSRVPRAFFVKQPKAAGCSSLPIPRIPIYERRSLVARLLLVTGSHVHTLLHRVLHVTSPTKDPSIFPQSRRKFSPLARPSPAYISHCSAGCAFCVPGTIIAREATSNVKSLCTRDKAFLLSLRRAFATTRSSLFLFVHLLTLRILGDVTWPRHALCRSEEFMPVAGNDKYHVSGVLRDVLTRDH